MPETDLQADGRRVAAAADGQPLTLEQLRSLREDILAVAAEHGASNVRVFGSVARGDARPDSDVDLLVDLDTGRTGFAYFGVLQDLQDALSKLLGRSVDVGTAVQEHARASVARDLVVL
ncbi:MAG: nucleotidyltransferase family protein [Candidatus Dormibacteria bacterium]